MSTPSITHRARKTQSEKMLEGEILSFTTVQHPPKGFPSSPRTIGLIRLSSGKQVMGQLIGSPKEIAIGKHVIPRMRLERISEQGLRIYDVAYEIAAPKHVEEPLKDFPGYILALYGPSGVGKSTVSKVLSSVLSERVEKVPILTTRKQKKGDDGEYQYVTTTVFQRLQKEGKIVAATEIPSRSEARWYGYRASDIQAIWSKGKTPVVVTEMHLLQNLSEHFGRRSILSFGLLPPGKSKRTMLSNLLHRLRSRGRDTEEQMADRLKNAEEDLAFLRERKELFDHILINDDLDTVIETLKGHVAQPQEALSN